MTSFDPRDALLHQQEADPARPDDFEFHLRGRRIRLLAEWLRDRLPGIAGIDPALIASRIAEQDDHRLMRDLVALAGRGGMAANTVMQAFEHCAAEARRQLIAERGDPPPA